MGFDHKRMLQAVAKMKSQQRLLREREQAHRQRDPRRAKAKTGKERCQLSVRVEGAHTRGS